MHLSAILTVLGSATLSRSHPTKKPTGQLLPRGIVDLNAFRLPMTSNYTNSEEIKNTKRALLAPGSDNPVEVATAHVKKMNPGLKFRLVDDHYVGNNGIAHVRFKQTVHDIDVDNAEYNVNVDEDGNVFSFGGSLYHGATPDNPPVEKRDLCGVMDALKSVKSVFSLPMDIGAAVAKLVGDGMDYAFTGVHGVEKDPKATVVYFMKGDGVLSLVWRIETDMGDNWLLSYVDKESHEIHGVVDWVSDATYKVYPWGTDSPDSGDRTVPTDPWDDDVSEFTWISDGKTDYTTTRGNNGIAQYSPSGLSAYVNNARPDSYWEEFEYYYDPTETDPTTYVNASVTQLFYTANKFHDLFYLLGFTEAAGNFEINNNGQGGKGNDFVVLNTQDGSGKNNANFATPPDGSIVRMRMYIWDMASPPRDSSFDAGVVIHEFTHGVSTRLTGGPANSNCLSALESGGMGEGWGDAMSLAIRLQPDDTRRTDYPAGAWVSGNPNDNPHMYTDLDRMTRVHDIGTVWVTMIYEVLWNLIGKHGKVPTDGKYLTMKLLVDAMALQPCNPSFLQARDAILDADKALTGGDNACEIWKGFAKRGLGNGSKNGWLGRTGSNEVPSGVC